MRLKTNEEENPIVTEVREKSESSWRRLWWSRCPWTSLCTPTGTADTFGSSSALLVLTAESSRRNHCHLPSACKCHKFPGASIRRPDRRRSLPGRCRRCRRPSTRTAFRWSAPVGSLRHQWVLCVTRGFSASPEGSLRHQWVSCVTSGFPAPSVCTLCHQWVPCIISGYPASLVGSLHHQ